jgi:TonB family protein
VNDCHCFLVTGLVVLFLALPASASADSRALLELEADAGAPPAAAEAGNRNTYVRTPSAREKRSRKTMARPKGTAAGSRFAALGTPEIAGSPLLSPEEAQLALDQDLALKVGKQMRPEDYPHEAVRSRWTGTALIEVLVSSQGLVTQVALSRSSGFQILDEQALAVVRRVTRVFMPFQLRSAEQRALVPIGFYLQE